MTTNEQETITLDEAQSLIDGGMTLDDLAAQHGGEIVEQCWVPPNAPVVALVHQVLAPEDDGNAEIEYDPGMDPEDAARAYVADGDWGDVDETIWIRVRTWIYGLDADGDECRVREDAHTIAVHPPKPECEAAEHEWDDPEHLVQLWGHGGGVAYSEVCRHCGAYRETDTWAQNPDTGEQGLTSIYYREADEKSLEWVASLEDED